MNTGHPEMRWKDIKPDFYFVIGNFHNQRNCVRENVCGYFRALVY